MVVVFLCCVPVVYGQLDWLVSESEVEKIESPSTTDGE